MTCILLFHGPGNEQSNSVSLTYWSTWRVRHFNFQVEFLSQEQKVPCDHTLNVWRTTKPRNKKHQSLHQPEKSSVAENSSSTRHCIDLRGTSILDRTWGYIDRLVKEASEIHLRFFHAFSSVVRQMPGENPQRRGTAHTLPIFCVVCIVCPPEGVPTLM
jgi:hypothetical protein